MTVAAGRRRIGIVGLGDQGTPIALRLMEAGWPLAFHARRPAVRERFARAGARPVSPTEMGAQCDIVLIVVGDALDVREVVVESGLLDAMRSGAIIVIHSSIPPDAVRVLAAEAQVRGVHLLDAPVSGGRTRSYAGDLTILVGGDDEVLKAVRPLLYAYGSTIARVGPIGSGQLMKSLNNYFYAAHLATAAKTIELVRALGLDVETAAALLPMCSGSSAALTIKAAGGFGPTGHDRGADHAMDLLQDVVNSLRASARDAGVDLELLDQLVDAGIASERVAGRGSDDPGPDAVI